MPSDKTHELRMSAPFIAVHTAFAAGYGLGEIYQRLAKPGFLSITQDHLIRYHLSSFAGAGATVTCLALPVTWAIIENKIPVKYYKKNIAAAAAITTVAIVGWEVRDAQVYGHGMDYADLGSGALAIAFATATALAFKPELKAIPKAAPKAKKLRFLRQLKATL